MALVSKAAVATHHDEECWESSLLPPRRALPARTLTSIEARRVPSPVKAITKASCQIAGKERKRKSASAASPTKAIGVVEGRPAAPEQEKMARLLSLEMKNFKCFEERTLSFEGDECSCIVGPNSSGKSSILDAIKFVTLQPVRSIRHLVRRCRPAILHCCVTAVFETESAGKVTLQRRVILDSPKEHRVTYAVAAHGSPLGDLSEAKYTSWIEKVLCWKEDAVIMSQFSLIEKSSVTELLGKLPKLLDKLEADGEIRPPMLKRRSAVGQQSNPVSSVTGIRTAAEAWVGRRLDELYCELSRQPLDELFQTWGDGGQACLRRLPDGSFTIFVSERRGLAALGYGSPLESLSDGDRDLCALALLLTLPGLRSGSGGLQDVLPPLVVLDEPDSRLDKRGACCLQRLLSGPGRPAQCLLTSLNNHHAFNDVAHAIVLPEVVTQSLDHDEADKDDPYGDARPRGRTGIAAASVEGSMDA